MFHEFTQAALFYLVFSLFGIFGFALLLRIPTKTNLKYLLAKPLGLLLFAYPVWLLSSIKLLKFNNQIVLSVLFILALFGALASIFLFLKDKRNGDIKKKVLNKSFLITFIIVEFVSLLLYFGYLYIRGFSSQLESTEKFMDLLMYMSAGKTQFFPFTDPWQAGLPVNYYYYGFYLFATLNRFSSVPYAMGYNFSLGIIFTFTVLLSFAVVYKLTKSVIFSFLGSGFVSLGGNIHYASCIYKNFKAEDLGTKCYYPAATRIYDPAYTINEMPSYSFALGDMHPHVMGIPFFLVNLFLILLFFKSKKINKYLIIALAISMSSSFMINTWDFIVLGTLFAILFIYKLVRKEKKNIKNLKDLVNKSYLLDLFKRRKWEFIIAASLAIAPVVLFLPFLLHFKSPVEGIGFAPEFVRLNKQPGQDFQYPSTPWFHFGLWGGYFVLSLVSLAILFIRKEKFKKYYIPFFITICAVIFIAFTELFYFKDLFHIANPQYFRANTVFKLCYLAWILWSISTAVLASYAWRNLRSVKGVYWGVLGDFSIIVLLQLYAVIAFLYPYYAVKQAYSPALPTNLKERTWTLDGSDYIKNREIDDYNTINWINANIKERIILVEAVGSSYTYYARISVNTGMINPVNWPSHEWTWRFHYPDDIKSWKDALGKSIDTGYGAVAVIEEDVRKIYESTDETETKDLLSRYKVDYVFIGNLERTKYTSFQEEKFSNLGSVVFESGNSRLYKINKN